MQFSSIFKRAQEGQSIGFTPNMFFLIIQVIWELLYIKMKQQISWADEQIPPMDMHPASLCNINPILAIVAHALYDFFLYILLLYTYISKSPVHPLSKYYLITMKKLFLQFPFMFP